MKIEKLLAIVLLTAGLMGCQKSTPSDGPEKEPGTEVTPGGDEPVEVKKGEVFIHTIKSKTLGERTIRVYVPGDYANSSRQYDVLYMQDGQMLFDSKITWNHQEWGVDEAMDTLQSKGYIRPTIVVGIDAAGTSSNMQRIEEYCPSDVAKYIASGHAMYSGMGTPKGNEYLQFVVEEVKPFIESTYPAVYKEREHTWIMGSSCGGLISSYAVNRYPEVFAGAACMSTHSTLSVDNTYDAEVVKGYVQYLTQTRPVNSYKIYFDRGDQTLDANYAETQEMVNNSYAAAGWDSEHFHYAFFSGAAHDEKSWRARLDVPLRFLLAK